jgi:ABC-type thiamin/hydroxymethylpyrimidine transport system permease subunit
VVLDVVSAAADDARPGARVLAMLSAHEFLAFLVIGVPALAALVGGLVYWRRRGAARWVAHLLALAQTLLVAQVALGLLLLSDDRRAADELHYAYGSLSLAAILAPWMYAPAEGPKRLLWFAGTSFLAAALAVRAFMTGS